MTATAADSASGSRRQIHRYWTGSFVSWSELVDIDDGTFADRADAQFYGTSIGRSVEKYRNSSKGTIREFSVLSGHANAGGTQTVLTGYQTSHRSWFGAQASFRFAFRKSPQVALSIGPTALFRQIKFPDEGTGYTIKSGSDLNVGLLAEARFRLTDRLLVQQTVGTLAFKASSIWSLGIGYMF